MPGTEKRMFLVDDRLQEMETSALDALTPRDDEAKGIEHCGKVVDFRCIGCNRYEEMILPNQCVLESGELAIRLEFRRPTPVENEHPR